MKVAIDGAPVEILPRPTSRRRVGASGVIVFAPSQIEAGLFRVSDEGGTVEPATLLDVTGRELPPMARVPARRHPFCTFVRAISAERRGVYLGRIDRPASTPRPPLFRSESEAVYARSTIGRAAFC